MVIEVRGQDQVSLLEADEFTRLSIRLSADLDETQRTQSAQRLGELAGNDHVFIEPELLISLAGPRGQDEDWKASFDGMIGYARSKGWADGQGRIQVHIEPAA